MAALLTVSAGVVLPKLELQCEVGCWLEGSEPQVQRWLMRRVMEEWLSRLHSHADILRWGSGIVVEVMPVDRIQGGPWQKDADARLTDPRRAPAWESVITDLEVLEEGRSRGTR
jgi:hypothetical protein